MITKSTKVLLRRLGLLISLMGFSYFLYLTWIVRKGSLGSVIGTFLTFTAYNVFLFLEINGTLKKGRKQFLTLFYFLLQLAIFIISTLVYHEPKPMEQILDHNWFSMINLNIYGSAIMMARIITEVFRSKKKKG